jgi:hypothetical protein
MAEKKGNLKYIKSVAVAPFISLPRFKRRLKLIQLITSKRVGAQAVAISPYSLNAGQVQWIV